MEKTLLLRQERWDENQTSSLLERSVFSFAFIFDYQFKYKLLKKCKSNLSD